MRCGDSVIGQSGRFLNARFVVCRAQGKKMAALNWGECSRKRFSGESVLRSLSRTVRRTSIDGEGLKSPAEAGPFTSI